jgi:hypothetical protein
MRWFRRRKGHTGRHRAGTAPTAVAQVGVAPVGVEPAGVAPAGADTVGVAPVRVETAGVAPVRVAAAPPRVGLVFGDGSELAFGVASERGLPFAAIAEALTRRN